LKKLFEGKRILITGGTGSLGRALVQRILSGQHGRPQRIVIFSRDESKQHDMRLAFAQLSSSTEEIIYGDYARLLEFRLGDIRDFHAIAGALRDVDIVFNAAALKQVPTCEYQPLEATLTNVIGAQHIVRSIEVYKLPVETVIGISTDKACKPISVMGMTKALQERILIGANLHSDTRFVCVRYGNVLASRGSVVPLFLDQIRHGGPVTVTTESMTRFLLSLDRATETICRACSEAEPGETYVPIVPTSRIINIAKALIDGRDIPIELTGRRPGEKIHEILIAEDEIHRTLRRGELYVIRPILPELSLGPAPPPALETEYSSRHEVMDLAATRELLAENGLLEGQGRQRIG